MCLHGSSRRCAFKSGLAKNLSHRAEPPHLDEAIKKKFAKKEMLLAKNLATVKRHMKSRAEWAEKNQY